MTNKIAAVFRRSGRRPSERGQALVLFAAGLAGFMGLVGIAIDIGQVVHARTDAQKVADAAALAGAQDLTNVAAATDSAGDYVELNGSAIADATVTISETNSANDTIEVKVDRQVEFTFLKAIGLSGTTVSAKAKVRIASFTGGSGLLPWGFVANNGSDSTLVNNACFDGWDGAEPQFKTGIDCTIKYGAGSGQAQGDFGALALDATGVQTYKNAIVDGSTNMYEVGDQVEAQTGDFGVNTKNALEDRLAQPLPADCQTNLQSQVMTYDGVSDTWAIKPDCYGHPRIGLVPVVDQINNPQKSTILAFAFIWIQDVQSLPGGQQSVDVQFLTLSGEIPGGYYGGDGTGAARIVKLME